MSFPTWIWGLNRAECLKSVKVQSTWIDQQIETPVKITPYVHSALLAISVLNGSPHSWKTHAILLCT